MSTVFERDEIAAGTMSRVSWGAVFAGAILATGLWVLFHVVGMAAGLTSIDPNSADSLRAAGIGTGIWSIIASLIALFVGGLAAARVAGPVDRVSGALHGAVLWALTTMAAVAIFASTAGMVLRGAAQMGSMAGSSGTADPNMQYNMLLAAESTGKAMWWVFFALLLGLASAVLGASVAVSRTQRRALERPRELPLGPTAQVHP